jgi:hypothetical protein
LANSLPINGLISGKVSGSYPNLFAPEGITFSISSLANAAWIFSWHYQLFSLSVAIMSIILISLISINNILNYSDRM